MVKTPKYDCKGLRGVPIIDAAATADENGDVTVFCVNRGMEEDCLLNLDLRSFGELRLKEHILLHHDDVRAVNTEADPDQVKPSAGPGGKVEGGRAEICLPALSWNVLRFERV